MFINIIFGHSLKENFWLTSHPNELVLGRLIINYKKSELNAKLDEEYKDRIEYFNKLRKDYKEKGKEVSDLKEG